jgi:hypothetical protein
MQVISMLTAMVDSCFFWQLRAAIYRLIWHFKLFFLAIEGHDLQIDLAFECHGLQKMLMLCLADKSC